MSLAVGLAQARIFGFYQGGRPMLRTELSLPTMLYGQNRNPLPFPLLMDAIETALGTVAEALPDVPTVAESSLQRLDLTRDFHGLQSPSRTLHAVSGRHINYARHHSEHFAADGRLQSVTRGSKGTYLIRGYDKAYQLRDAASRAGNKRGLLEAWADASDGQLRFELQLRATMLRKERLIFASDLSNSTLEHLIQAGFVRARWGEPYGDSRFIRRLEKLRPTLTTADYRNLSLYAFCRQSGMEVPLTRHVVDRIRPIAHRHNLLDPDDGQAARRLDFDLGRELDI